MVVYRVLEERDIKPKVKFAFRKAVTKMREKKMIQINKKSEIFFNTMRNNKHKSREERLALIISVMQEMAGVGQSNQTLKQMTPIMEDEKPGSANKIQDEDENQVLPSGAKTPYVSAEQQQLNPQNSQNLELEQEEEIRAVTLQADTFTLRIKANQRQMEELLQNMIQVQSSKTAHYMMMLLITSYFIMTLILITIRNDFFSGNLFLFFIRSCFILLLILGTFLYEKAFKVPWIKYSLFLVFLGGMAPSFLMAFYTDNRDFSAVQTLELIFIFTIASNLK